MTPVYGGQSISLQVRQLKQKNDVVVGTPGRLMDHLKSRKLDLSEVKYVVLDEADEMLTAGFEEELEFILSKTNPDRRTILFSATMPREILKLAKNYMNDYEVLEAKKETLATTLTKQLYVEVRESDKLEAVCRIMDVEAEFYGLIFCRTKRDVDAVNDRLMQRGYESEAMHGDLSQAQRERVLKKFRGKQCKILVVTDVASRGLDITGLSHVVNYAIPQDPESYVHRVGRTGRAGQSGTAITLITPAEFRKLGRIQKVAKTQIEKAPVPDVKTIITNKKNRIINKIQEAISSGIDDNYNEFAQQLVGEQDPADILAGVLKVAFSEELLEKNYSDIRAAGKRSKDSRDRDRGRGRDRERGRGRERDRGDRGRGGRDRAGADNVRLFVAKGRLDRMNPRKLVDMIEKKSNVRGRHIKGVDIFESFSFINVPKRDADRIIQSFKQDGRDNRALITIAKD